MAKKKHPLGFVVKDGRVFGSLQNGLKIGETMHKDFELREATVDDLLEAENEADVTKPLNFNAVMLTRQLVKVGSFDGEITLGMIRRLKTIDWRLLRAAQQEVDDQGEDEPASAPAS